MKYYKVEIDGKIQYCCLEEGSKVFTQHIIANIHSLTKSSLSLIEVNIADVEDFVYVECSEREYWMNIENVIKEEFDRTLADMQQDILEVKEKKVEALNLVKNMYYDKNKNCNKCIGQYEDGYCRVRDVFVGGVLENCEDFIKRGGWYGY